MQSASMNELIELSMAFSVRHSDVVMNIFKNKSLKNTTLSETLRNLNMYLCDRGRGIVVLVCNDMGWDAEILLRCYYECSAKILNFCMSSEEEDAQLLDEFWGQLGSISTRRVSRKASFAKQVFPVADQSARNVFEALESEKFRGNEQVASKALRKKIEQKWSFSEIIEHLDNKKKLTGAKALLHIYGMASHLTHSDASAINLLVDRSSRGSEERLVLSEGHISRILSDIVNIGYLSIKMTQSKLKIRTEDVDSMYEDVKLISDKTKFFQDRFDQSQKSFYDDFLNEN